MLQEKATNFLQKLDAKGKEALKNKDTSLGKTYQTLHSQLKEYLATPEMTVLFVEQALMEFWNKEKKEFNVALYKQREEEKAEQMIQKLIESGVKITKDGVNEMKNRFDYDLVISYFSCFCEIVSSS